MPVIAAGTVERARSPAAFNGVEQHGGGVPLGSVRARAVRAAGIAYARCGGVGVRVGTIELWRVEPAGQPAGSLSAWIRRGFGCVGRAVPGTFARDGSGTVGGSQGGWSLCPARPT